MTSATGRCIRRVGRVLPDARATARVARRAALAITRPSASSWDRKGLEQWWAVDYRAAAEPPPARTVSLPPSEQARVLEGRAGEVILAAQRAVRERLTTETSAARLLDEALSTGLASIAIDAGESALWVPVDFPGAALAERILSLFAIDLVVRVGDYGLPFTFCDGCGLPKLDRSCDCVRRLRSTVG